MKTKRSKPTTPAETRSFAWSVSSEPLLQDSPSAQQAAQCGSCGSCSQCGSCSHTPNCASCANCATPSNT